MKLFLKFSSVLATLALASCGQSPATVEMAEPTMYRSLAAQGAEVDTDAARAMLSQYRANKGLGPLVVDPGLQRVAESQARGMAADGKISHESHGSLTQRLDGAGYRKNTAVENVSAGYHTLAEAFSGWRDSPPHNRNLLEPRMRRMGIAAAYAPGTKYKVFWALVMTD